MQIEQLSPQDTLIYGKCHLSIPQLLQQIQLNHNEQLQYNTFAANNRKQEWLWVRYLLQQHTHTHQITYSSNGKPNLWPADHNISISHSSNFAAIRIGQTKQQHGLDVEHSNRQITHIATRFASPADMQLRPNNMPINDFLLHLWCAKEAVYKAAQHTGIHFVTQMQLTQFTQQPKSIIGISLQTDNKHEHYTLLVRRIHEYILVCTQ